MKVEAKIVVENAGPVAHRGGGADGKFGEVLDRGVGEAAADEEVVAEEGECAEEMPGDACVVDASVVSAAEPTEVMPMMELVASAPAPVEASIPAEAEPEEGSIPPTATAATDTTAKAIAPDAAATAARDREVASPRASVPASPTAIVPDRSSVAARAPTPHPRSTETATPSPRARVETPTHETKPTHTETPASRKATAPASGDAPVRTSIASHAKVDEAPAPRDDAPAPHDDGIEAPRPRVAEPAAPAPEAAVPTDPATPATPTFTASTPATIDAAPAPAVGLEPIVAPDVPAPTDPTTSTIDPTLPTTPTAESPDPAPLAEEPTATPRTSDPEIADRIEKVRTALEKLRPIPDGGVAVDVDLDGIGRVELRVEPIDGGLRVSLGTDEPTALARLEAQRSELEQALRHNGETLSLDIHTNGRRARTPRPPVVPSRDGDHTPSRTDTAPPRRSGRGLVDIVA